jgi:alpha-L-rhamnosidase
MNRRQLLALCGSSLLARGGRISLAEDITPWTSADTATADQAFFQVAKPVWPKGRETEMNLFVGFRAIFNPPRGKPIVLRVAASTLYRFFVNGQFKGFGPARGPHGYYRVDEWDITRDLSSGDNVVAIEVAGYNINSYYILNQPSFLQAEIASGTEILGATGNSAKPFKAKLLAQLVQKVERYSFQRAFTEVYHLPTGVDDWRSDPNQTFPPESCSFSEEKQLISRQVPYPQFSRRQPEQRIMQGDVTVSGKVAKPWKPRFLTDIGPKLLGFTQQQLAEIPSFELQRVTNKDATRLQEPYSWTSSFPLSARTFHIFDFGTDLTGFIGARVRVRTPTRLYLTFDEMLVNGDIDFKRLDTVNIVAYKLAPGDYHLEPIEPYTLRFLKFLALQGDCEVSQIHLREYVNPNVWTAHFDSSDEGLNVLFAAGRETFRQNSVDLFMDCPSRERAGWLCDSYFTSRVEHQLSGGSTVEDVFFQNFLLPGSFAHLPEGMLPMCYPADHYNGQFIPNWALWFVLQLQEYLGRSGNHEMLRALRQKIVKLFDYFRLFLNQDGLLENLKGWIFIEWSAANNYTQDVNYPTNMLYAAALEAAGKMYGMQAWGEQAAAVRKAIRKQSFDGQFFVDNAVRKGGKLVPTRYRTETCQYYAFYLGTATPEAYGTLWNVLVKDFGPSREKTQRYPDIPASNAFIGNVLRLELLSRYGSCRQLIDESRKYLLHMAERTGTLWENIDTRASLDHGFASHIVNVLYRDVLGLYQIDWVNKRVHVRFTDTTLDSCEGRVPVPEGAVSLRWKKQDGKISYRLDVPAGYAITVENKGGMPLEMMGAPSGKEKA